ncbi:hypothetical protein [Streptomyces sp. NPDC102282]|uniref:hypothetical protein n=1 Tax=Streptomyces sp. NPDC102282 TaxID=3366154 RepID=UPI0037FF7BC2
MVLASLLLGAAVTGCASAGEEKEFSADDLLAEAHETMGDLKTVTVTASTTGTAGSSFSSRPTTDLEGRCANKITWTNDGSLQQIRIDGTDYVRPDRVYLARWSGHSAAKDQNRWIRTSAARAKQGDGLVDCTWPFTAFGTAAKGGPTEVEGRPALALKVADEAGKGETQGAYTFYVATEGKPYLLRVVYQGNDYRSTTTFSAFDKPLGVRAPAADTVLDSADAG